VFQFETGKGDKPPTAQPTAMTKPISSAPSVVTKPLGAIADTDEILGARTPLDSERPTHGQPVFR
jgi:hypothetical protein